MKGKAVELGAGFSAAVALWFSLGAIATTSDGSRLGVLPPVWLLVLVILGATVVVARFRPARERCLPLFFAAILLLPWLPGRVPASFLIWTGPIKAFVWLAILVGALAVREIGLPVLAKRALTDPARASWLAGLFALSLYGMAHSRLVPLLPGGDEPHYLIVAQSLLKDGDLDVQNNYERRDYLAYFSGELRPHYLRRALNNKIYSIHAPGLPVLIAPAFAVAGYPGVVYFLSLLSALGSALAWRASYALTRSAGAAWFGWGAVAASAPFLIHAVSVYPDAVASTLVLTGVVALAKPRLAPGAWHPFLHGAALALLPWLHVRLAVPAGALLLMILLRMRAGTSRKSDVAWFLSAPVASIVAWLAFFYTTYGTLNPAGPYGRETEIGAGFLASGLGGLFFDAQFGLVSNAPVLSLAGIGLVMAAIRGGRALRRLAIEIAILTLPYLTLAGAYRMWWGGASAPARLSVPVVLPLAIPAALLWHLARTRATRLLALLALTVTVSLSAALVAGDGGRLAYNSRDGISLLFEWLSPAVDFALAVPSFLRSTPGLALGKTVIWALVLSAAWLSVARLERARVLSSGITLSALASLAIAVMVGAELAWRLERSGGAVTAASQVEVLRHFDPETSVGVGLAPARFVGVRDFLSRIELRGMSHSLSGEPTPLLSIKRVPAGTYVVRIETRSGPEGVLSAYIGRTSVPIQTMAFASRPRERSEFEIPIPVDVDSLRIDALPTDSIVDVALGVSSIVSRRERLSGVVAKRAARYGGAAVYFLDDGAFPEREGFWIGVDEVGLALQMDPPGTTAHLRVRNSPVPNRLTVAVDDWRRAVPLAPREELTLEIPLHAERRLTLLRLHAAYGFRPIELDSGSKDFRRLGCWIEVRREGTLKRSPP